MNCYVLTAAAFSLFTTIGHFAMGTKLYLVPMLKSDLEPLAAKVMQAVFHYSRKPKARLAWSSAAAATASTSNIVPCPS